MRLLDFLVPDIKGARRAIVHGDTGDGKSFRMYYSIYIEWARRGWPAIWILPKREGADDYIQGAVTITKPEEITKVQGNPIVVRPERGQMAEEFVVECEKILDYIYRMKALPEFKPVPVLVVIDEGQYWMDSFKIYSRMLNYFLDTGRSELVSVVVINPDYRRIYKHVYQQCEVFMLTTNSPPVVQYYQERCKIIFTPEQAEWINAEYHYIIYVKTSEGRKIYGCDNNGGIREFGDPGGDEAEDEDGSDGDEDREEEDSEGDDPKGDDGGDGPKDSPVRTDQTGSDEHGTQVPQGGNIGDGGGSGGGFWDGVKEAWE